MVMLKLRAPPFLPRALEADFGTLGSEFFIPNFFGFDDFGREQAHFLDPANGLVLAGDFNRAFRFLATVVQSA
jgi:hypothetical protein